MSEVNKPTRWAYAVYGPKTFGLGESGEGAFFQIRCMYGDVKMQENIEAMEFIRDAKRIHHETGLTPRQLVEQRDALAKALEFALLQNEHDMLLTGEEIRMGRLSLALVKGEQK